MNLQEVEKFIKKLVGNREIYVLASDKQLHWIDSSYEQFIIIFSSVYRATGATPYQHCIGYHVKPEETVFFDSLGRTEAFYNLPTATVRINNVFQNARSPLCCVYIIIFVILRLRNLTPVQITTTFARQSQVNDVAAKNIAFALELPFDPEVALPGVTRHAQIEGNVLGLYHQVINPQTRAGPGRPPAYGSSRQGRDRTRQCRLMERQFTAKVIPRKRGPKPKR